jgi:hypothetical protein
MQNYVVLLQVNPFSIVDVQWYALKSYWQGIDVHLCSCMFLGVFEKLWKAGIGFVMSVCPLGTAGYHWADFNEVWYLIIFRKPVEKNKFDKIWKE